MIAYVIAPSCKATGYCATWRDIHIALHGKTEMQVITKRFVVITHIFCARQKTKPQPRITRMRANFLNQFVKIREIRGKMLWL